MPTEGQRLNWAYLRSENIAFEADSAIEHLQLSGVPDAELSDAFDALVTAKAASRAAVDVILARLEAPEEPVPPDVEPEEPPVEEPPVEPPDPEEPPVEPEPPVVEPGETFVTVPDTIPGADDSDQTAALQAFFDEAGDGVHIHVPRLFRFDGAGPRLRHRRGVRVFGPGGFTTPTDGWDVEPTPGHGHKWPRTRNRFTLEGCDDIVLDGGLQLQGSNQENRELRGYVAELEGQHGIDCVGSHRVRIGDVHVFDVRGDWLYFGGGPRPDGTRDWSRDVVVRGADLGYNGRQGIALTGIAGLLVEGVRTTHCRRTLIDFEANGTAGGAVDITFRENEFGPHHLTFLAIHRRGVLARILLERNTLYRANVLTPSSDRNREMGWESRIAGLALVGNVATASVGNPQGAAWRIAGVDGLYVRENRILASGSRDMHLAVLNDCTGVDLPADPPQCFTPGGDPLPTLRPESEYTPV